jgi:hypothetical protein
MSEIQKMDETHNANLSEIKLPKLSQEIVNNEMAQLRELSGEMHKLIRDMEKEANNGS